MSFGPKLPFAQQLHAEKYRGPGETFEESQYRVATPISDGDDHYHALIDATLNQRFVFGGRVQNAVGSPRDVTALNCFVAPTISDSFVDGDDCIMEVARKAAATLRRGGGIGYDFSTLRPRGSRIVSIDSRSTGAVSFMGIFDQIGGATSSTGNRRGAQMAVLRVDHPDIEEFIRAKQNRTSLTHFNVSVGVTDEFMRCVQSGDRFALRWQGEIHSYVDARALWDMIMRSTWDWAEPGVLFLDTINRDNNLSYCETISATNPCAEQCLPPNGACLLGSFNLTKYIDAKGVFQYDLFAKDIPVSVRALDNVCDNTIYPLPEQQAEQLAKRRLGIGVMGLANALEVLSPYATADFLARSQTIAQILRDGVYAASVELAKEKGAFPKFDRDQYLKSPFVQRLPDAIQEGIYEHGIRNSHLLSIAPTGTISMTCDNISSGIEPVFSEVQERTVRMDAGEEIHQLTDYGIANFGTVPRKATDVSPEEHVSVAAVFAPYMDSAISKTCNVPGDIGWEAFKDVYFLAWKHGLKGCTTYRPGGKREAILREVTEGSACSIDPDTGQKDCS